MLKVKVNENFIAILTYLQTYQHYIDLRDLVQWCIDYEYYKELYQNWHIIKDMLAEHNRQYPDPEEPVKLPYEMDEDSLL